MPKAILGLSQGRRGRASAPTGAVPAAPCPGPCARRARRLLSRLCTASVEPQTQLIASQRPLGDVPAANVPHFPLLRPCKASCGEALAQRIHRSAPPARTHRHRAPAAHPHGTYGSHEKTIPQPANPKLHGGTVCASRQAWQRKPLLHRCPIYSPL